MASKRPSWTRAVERLPEGVTAVWHSTFERPMVAEAGLTPVQVAGVSALGWTHVEPYACYFGPKCESP